MEKKAEMKKTLNFFSPYKHGCIVQIKYKVFLCFGVNLWDFSSIPYGGISLPVSRSVLVSCEYAFRREAFDKIVILKLGGAEPMIKMRPAW